MTVDELIKNLRKVVQAGKGHAKVMLETGANEATAFGQANFADAGPNHYLILVPNDTGERIKLNSGLIIQ